MSLSSMLRFLPAVACLTILGGCAALHTPASPDTAYSKDAAAAVKLQVPPDLTGVSDAEQFVLPGNAGGPVTRNTLLPQFESVRFVRDEGEAHLAFDAPPEDLWPRLLAFLGNDGWEVDRTEPVAGILATRWRVASGAERPGALRSLIGGGAADTRSRVAFRLERAADGARLYARRQVATADAVADGSADDWPAASSDPEATSALLARLLVFLGVDEQVSRGLIDTADASELLEAATVRTGGAGSTLVVHRGYRSAWEAVLAALSSEGMSVSSTDDSVGRIEFSTPDAAAADATADADATDVATDVATGATDAGAAATPAAGTGGAATDRQGLVLDLVPVHVGAVRVGITDAEGRRLDAGRERTLLDALRAALLRNRVGAQAI